MYLHEGLRMHYLDEGEGSPIVALHGNPTWSFFYRELVKRFKSGHRMIVPDHIGCGLSDKPQNYNYTLEQHIANLEELIERLNPEPFTMVVHDWGGAIGMGYAVRHPEMIKGILFLNTAAFRSPDMPATIGLARIPWLGDLLVRGLNAFVIGALLTSTYHPLGAYICNAYLSPYNSWNNRVGVLRFVQDIPMKPSHPSYQTLTDIENKLSLLNDVPKSFVWGARDHVFTPRFLERWKTIYPSAKTTLLEKAGHFVIEDASEKVILALRELLNSEASDPDIA